MSNSSLSALRLSKSVPRFFSWKRGECCNDVLNVFQVQGSIQNKNWKLRLSLHICSIHTRGAIYTIYIHPSDLWLTTHAQQDVGWRLPTFTCLRSSVATISWQTLLFFGGVSKAWSRTNFQIYHSHFAAKSSPSALSWFRVSSGALLISSNVSSPEPSWKLQYPGLGGCLERCLLRGCGGFPETLFCGLVANLTLPHP